MNVTTLTVLAMWKHGVEHNLDLNVSKIREVMFDFRVNQNVKNRVIIDDSNVDFVENYTYLGCTIVSSLPFKEHAQNQV